jgi:hypothetical protein
MTAAANPSLRPGGVYRTRDLHEWGTNAPRLAKRLVAEKKLVPLARGLFVHEKTGRFGAVPPDDAEVMRAFLRDTSFIFTGPERWNALGLGSTAVFAMPLVYNKKRTGVVELGGRPFTLRRVAFPEKPSAEWYVVDLIEHADEAGVARSELQRTLKQALARNKFDRAKLQAMANTYATKATKDVLESAMQA